MQHYLCAKDRLYSWIKVGHWYTDHHHAILWPKLAVGFIWSHWLTLETTHCCLYKHGFMYILFLNLSSACMHIIFMYVCMHAWIYINMYIKHVYIMVIYMNLYQKNWIPLNVLVLTNISYLLVSILVSENFNIRRLYYIVLLNVVKV